MAISKDERDKLMSSMSNVDRMDFGKMLREVKAEAMESGGTKTKQDVMAALKSDCSEELQKRLDGVMRRDQMGPHEGVPAPDFNLKLKGSEHRVRLSSFRGQRPVALVFGSYT